MTERGRLSRIAAELGISRQAASKLAARGMPVDDPDAARGWRSAHLNPAKVKADPGPSTSTLIARVDKLAELAEHARTAGRLDLAVPALRAALREVPAAERGAVALPPWLWEALIGEHALCVLDDGPQQVGDMPDEDAAELGDLVGALACGEAIIK